MDLLEFMYRLRGTALDMGFSPTHSVSLKLIGPSSGFKSVTRTIEISETAPLIHTGQDISLWFCPSALVISKTAASAWTQVHTYDDMFFETVSGSGGTLVTPAGLTAVAVDNAGIVTAPVFLQRDPVMPNEAVTKQYLDQVLSLVTSGRLLGYPVQDLVALRFIDTASLTDKQVAYVEDKRTMYAYDAQGTGVDDNVDIIRPASNQGRWFSTSPSTLSGGVF